MAAYHLRTFYLAQQQTWNTPTAPNVRLEGVTDGSVTINVDDDVVETLGVNVGHIRMRKERESEITISLVATYEQILYVLHGLFGAVSPTNNSGLYVWTYEVPRTNTATPQLYTIQYGIDNTIYQLSNCLLSETTFKGEVKNALELELTFICPEAPTVLSSAPSITPTQVNAIHVREAEFYFSSPSGNPLSQSPLEATLISFEINVNPNRHIKRFIGNSTGFGDGRWEIDGTLVLEFAGTAKALINLLSSSANTVMYNTGLRFISSENNNIQVSILMPVLFTDSVELFSDRDGNATVEFGFKGVYNPHPSTNTALQITVQTTIDTLP